MNATRLGNERHVGVEGDRERAADRVRKDAGDLPISHNEASALACRCDISGIDRQNSPAGLNGTGGQANAGAEINPNTTTTREKRSEAAR